MWPVIVTGIAKVVESWFDAKKAKHQAEIRFQEKMGEMEATWDLVALRQAQFSWKDEFITLIIFAPPHSYCGGSLNYGTMHSHGWSSLGRCPTGISL
jgi:hypothetical protein